LSRRELEEKFLGNAAYGGWPEDLGKKFLDFALDVTKAKDLSQLKDFRR
jgi:hypothetical protein